ncbi:hybrid sensor histidine kinase/response regulator [Hydrogenophaga sp. NFH-34]|uniref:hybrid sensor histidine kinase/response regulator n=1 Tax=Hydrogenophaga sp. NFH-34 TaxID=2744446 RepID=UPI001F31E7D6|nr:hybrid sensor histidine kinase/response regulator [Hydrogenophaga sp. NFH-34]
MARRLSLGPTLMAAFLLTALLPAAMVAWLLSSNSSQSIKTLAENAMSQAAHRVDVGALAHLGESHTVVNALVPPFEISGAEASRTRNWLRDTQALEEMAYALTQQSPNVPYLYAGKADGAFFGLEKEERGFVVREIQPGEPGRRQYLIRKPGDRSTLEKVEDTLYDPRQRPWYQLAARSGQRVFTSVYRSAVKPQFDLTLAHPIYTAGGHQLLGVIAVDMSLARLTDLIRSTRISENAVTYLVDQQGLFVASSVDEELSTLVDGRHRRLSPEQSRDPLVRTSYEQLRTLPPTEDQTSAGLVRLSPPPSLWHQIGLGESRLIALQRPFGAKFGLDWRLIVVAPERDFTGSVIRARQWALAGMVGLMLVCAAAALMLARGLSRQFSRLNASASALGAGDIPPIHNDAPLHEVRHLSQVMHDSAHQLQAYNREIRLKNEQLLQAAQLLEERVRARTAELATSREEALAAARAKAGFLAVMSHEIRTPLNGVMGMSELLADTPLTDTQRGLFNVLRLSCGQLQSVVGDILDFSRIEAGRLDLEQRPFDLHAAIGDSRQMVQLAALEKGLSLQTHIGADVPRVIVGDVTRLRQVLLNLLSNAIKFTHTGGITLDVRQLGTEADGSQRIGFTVTDTGVGIRPEKLGQLFQPFAQGDTSTTRVYGGTGLGLVICRHLVGLMGGQIRVQSHPGQGSAFTFDIRTTAGTTDDLQPANAATLPPSRAGLRVLVVDDNTVNLRVAAAMLHRLGHAHATADGGQAAIEAIAAAHTAGQPFTHVLLDRHMPDLDGIAAARAILAGWGDQAPRLIGVSASSLGEDRQRCLDAGMSDYLAKPLQLAELAQALASPTAGAQPAPPAVAALPTEALPWLDAGRWAGFAEFDDAAGTLRREVIGEFLAALDARLAGLTQALQDGDIPLFRERAHFLAGSAANVGASRLAAACMAAEQMAAHASGAEQVQQLAIIQAGVAPTRAALQTLIQPAV